MLFMGVQYFGAVVFDSTKVCSCVEGTPSNSKTLMQVLIVSGKRATSGEKTAASYVFDTVTGSYTRTATDPYGSGGMSHMGCGIKPLDKSVILCAGGTCYAVGVSTKYGMVPINYKDFA